MITQRQYVEFLIATTGNYTCTNLADHLEGDQAMRHDAISDFLRREKLTSRRLWDVVAPLIEYYLLHRPSAKRKDTHSDFLLHASNHRLRCKYLILLY